MATYNIKTNQIIFETTDVDLSILNGIRRVLLMDIPILGIIGNGTDSTVNIIENTTVLNNEIIENRIALIPLNITEDYNDKFIFGEDKLTLSLDVSCQEFEDIKTITTRDLIVTQNNKQVNNFFKEPYCIITKLRKNEKLKLTADAVKETGRKNASFNIVSGVTLYNKPKGDLETYKNTIDYEKDYIEGHYIFKFEIINNTISHKYMLMKAVDIIINKLSLLMEKSKIEKFNNNVSTYDFEFENENDTIGNIIQSYIFDNYVTTNKKIIENNQCIYVGYIVKHPLDKILTIRLTLENENIETAKTFLKQVCEEIIVEKLQPLKNKFSKFQNIKT